MIGLAEPLVDKSACDGVSDDECTKTYMKPVFDKAFNTDERGGWLESKYGWYPSAAKLSRNVAYDLQERICPAIAARTDLVLPGQVIVCDTINFETVVRRRCSDSSVTTVQAVGLKFKSTLNAKTSSIDVKLHYDKQKILMDEIREEFSQFATVMDRNAKYKTSINEVVAVYGALWGVGTSLMLCFAAVVLFKASTTLVVIVMTSIFVNVVIVLGSFGMAKWQLGGIEAVSLSILVGTCVDYAIHLMEGYLEANWENTDKESVQFMSVTELRTALSTRGLETGGSKNELKERCNKQVVHKHPGLLPGQRKGSELASFARVQQMDTKASMVAALEKADLPTNGSKTELRGRLISARKVYEARVRKWRVRHAMTNVGSVTLT